MTFGVAIFTGLLLLVITDFLAQIKPPKSPEQEFGEAVTKYLAEDKKKKADKKDEK